jgi:hypothetical protein
MSYQEAIIIPLSLFKECKLSDKKPDELASLLDNKSMPPDKKMKLYHELQRKRRHTSPKPEQKHLQPRDNVLEPPSEEKYITKEISVEEQPYVASILANIRPFKNEISWDKDLQVEIDSKPMIGSNIVSLLQWVTNNVIVTRHSDIPIGALEFHDKLIKLGIPKSWLKVKITSPPSSSQKKGKGKKKLKGLTSSWTSL